MERAGNLEFGVNHVNVFGEDFPVSKNRGSFFAGRIPYGLTLCSAGLEIFDPPKVVGPSRIPISLAVGTSEDEEYFVSWFTPADLDGEVETVWNGGKYFSSEHFLFKSDLDIYLSYSYSISMSAGNMFFTVGPSFLSTDYTPTGAGDGYTALLIHGTSNGTEYFDSVAWQWRVNVPVRTEDGAAVGKADECLLFGGDNNSTIHNKTQFFNGVSWTVLSDLPYAARCLGGVGEFYSALAYGGHNSNSVFNKSAFFNGVSWNAGPSLVTAKFGFAFFGKPDDALCVAGRNVLTFNTTSSCERFGGVSWFSIAPILAQEWGCIGLGKTGNEGLACLGQHFVNDQATQPVNYNRSFIYRDPVWMNGPDASVARCDGSRSGNEDAGMLLGGHYDQGLNQYPTNTVDLLRTDVALDFDFTIHGNIRLVFILS
ncbi:MAG: hypothetical protein QW835_00160 [Candidatus Hadarchaeum sp.]